MIVFLDESDIKEAARRFWNTIKGSVNTSLELGIRCFVWFFDVGRCIKIDRVGRYVREKSSL